MRRSCKGRISGRLCPARRCQRRASEIFCSNWSHRSRVVGLVQATLRRATLSVWTASDPSSQSALTPLVKRSSPPPAIRLDEPSRSVRHPRARALASNGRRKSAAERSAGGKSKSKASHDSGIGVAAGWLASAVPQPTSATTNKSLRIRADDTRGPPARRHHQGSGRHARGAVRRDTHPASKGLRRGFSQRFSVGPAGLEPATYGLKVRSSTD
jgi:hypothetical protein